MDCVKCNEAFAYTSYIRVMKRSEKTHRSRQVWLPMGIYCVSCGHSVQNLDDRSRRAIIARRQDFVRQQKMKLENMNITPST